LPCPTLLYTQQLAVVNITKFIKRAKGYWKAHLGDIHRFPKDASYYFSEGDVVQHLANAFDDA
jgi:hypothetical protein